jgi:Arc/MetJ-type ribon-helix-helix transcriptional regulator
MRKVSVDLPDDVYRELIRIKYEKDVNENEKVPVGELIRVAVKEWLDKQKAAH